MFAALSLLRHDAVCFDGQVTLRRDLIFRIDEENCRAAVSFGMLTFFHQTTLLCITEDRVLREYRYEGWNFNSGNYLFTTDTK